MDTIRLITGIVMIIFGIFLMFTIIGALWGIPIFIIGIVIISNSNEDKIEEIKQVKGGKK